MRTEEATAPPFSVMPNWKNWVFRFWREYMEQTRLAADIKESAPQS